MKQAVKERWKPTTGLNKYVKNVRKSRAARYSQLKSGHAITAVHLKRVEKPKTHAAGGATAVDRPSRTSCSNVESGAENERP